MRIVRQVPGFSFHICFSYCKVSNAVGNYRVEFYQMHEMARKRTKMTKTRMTRLKRWQEETEEVEERGKVGEK